MTSTQSPAMQDLRTNVLPVTAIVGLLGVATAAAWTGSQWKAALDRNTEAIAVLTDRLSDTYTRADHEAFVVLLQAWNPSLKFGPEKKDTPR